MKKYILGLVLGLSLVACNNKDGIWTNAMGDVDARLYYLEQLCMQMNTNITSLQVIINSMESGDYITSVTPITQGGETIGYTITFAKNGSITIYNGVDGKDGVDGSTPIIGAAQDSTDGLYYWTINGAWLLDADGNRVRVTGNDGQDGQDGQDGVTPQLKIEDGMWYVSYDGGTTWILAGQATGDTGATGATGATGPTGPAGPAGQNGDSMFQSVTQDADNVYFTLADGTVIVVAKRASAYSGPIIKDGAVMAAYSVSATRQVYFSMGNLQYQASTDTWRFAPHQYDYVGADNLNASATYTGWIDLFGWATSGYYDEYLVNYLASYFAGVTYHYQPWDMTPGGDSYCGYGPNEGDICLEDYYANFDWGFYNAISNGGNQTRQWRTLKYKEWEYVLLRRGIDLITATVYGKQGYLLRPDNYSTTVDSLLLSIVPSGDYSSGISMDTLKWREFENEGCIFLPFAGHRSYHASGYGSYHEYNTNSCMYWSATADNSSYTYSGSSAYCVYGSYMSQFKRYLGLSVRVVKDVK